MMLLEQGRLSKVDLNFKPVLDEIFFLLIMPTYLFDIRLTTGLNRFKRFQFSVESKPDDSQKNRKITFNENAEVIEKATDAAAKKSGDGTDDKDEADDETQL
jgi:hypothetical protein